MEKNDNRSNPASTVIFSTLILGLASFVVWLLRLKPGASPKSPSLQVPNKRSQPDIAASDMPQTSSVTAYQMRPETQLAPVHTVVDPSVMIPGVVGPSDDLPAGQATVPITRKSTKWTAPTRYIAGVSLLLFFLWLINYSQQTLSMLVFAALIAILSRPIIRFLQKRFRFSPGLAVVFTYLLVAVLVIALPVLVIPNLIHGVNMLLDYNWQGLFNSVGDAIGHAASLVSRVPIIGHESANTLNSLSEFSQNLLTTEPQPVEPNMSVTTGLNNLGNAIGILGKLLGPLVSSVISLIFMLLISLQMSLASGQIRGWITNPVPERFKGEIETLLDHIQLIWVSFLRGQFALMVVMGLLVWLMNALLGTPQAMLLGFLAGLLEVIPSLGPILATIPAAIFALLFGSNNFQGLHPLVFMLIVILGYVLLNLVENQVLVPQILGEAVSLPPLIVLIGVTIAGAKAGIVGVFLATPVIATGRELVEYVYRKVIEAPEEGPPEEEKPSIMDQMRSFVGRIQLRFRRQAQVEKNNS